jgi:hypothetical protein
MNILSADFYTVPIFAALSFLIIRHFFTIVPSGKICILRDTGKVLREGLHFTGLHLLAERQWKMPYVGSKKCKTVTMLSIHNAISHRFTIENGNGEEFDIFMTIVFYINERIFSIPQPWITLNDKLTSLCDTHFKDCKGGFNLTFDELSLSNHPFVNALRQEFLALGYVVLTCVQMRGQMKIPK